MLNKIVMSLVLTAAVGAPAFAHGYNQQPPLIGALVTAGNHGSIATVGAAIGTRSSLADVHANVLNNAVRADIDVGQTTHRTQTLLGISATVLDGGVGHRPW